MASLLQNATDLLQNTTVITKCDVYWKMRQYSDTSPNTLPNVVDETTNSQVNIEAKEYSPDGDFRNKKFIILGFGAPYRLDRNSNDGGLMLFVREVS